MMVCPNCGKTVEDDSMQFCPACGFSFLQQPNQQNPSNQYGPRPYGQAGYPRKNTGIALVLSFFFSGLGQLYVGKILRGITFLVIYGVMYAGTFMLTLNVKTMDDINALVGNPLFIILTIAQMIFWVYNMYDAYKLANKYNEASRRNDLATFQKGF